MRRLLALLLLAALAPAAPSARADEPTGATVVLDWPGSGVAITSPVTLLGWAVSGEGSRGTGVDAVTVYLDGPSDVGTALGRAAYGQPRPDVAAARGDGRYAPSGWTLRADLPPGSHTLYVYAHLADRPAEQGWVGPWQIALVVEGGPAVAGPAPREGPTTPVGPGAAMPSARDGQMTGIGGGGACLDREVGSGRCLTFGGSNYTACAVPDKESGRCLVRPSTAQPGGGGPAAAAIPGSWSAYSLLSVGAGPGGSTAESLLNGAATQPGAQVNGPLGSGLGSLLSQRGGASGGGNGGASGGPGAASGWGATTGATPPAASGTTLARVNPAGRGSAAGLGSTVTGGATRGPTGGAQSISLTTVQSGGMLRLNWNQIAGAATYEIRRCTSLSSPTETCTLIALSNAGSYIGPPTQGVIAVRAVGPLGQVFGESNRLQVCCND